MNFKLLLLIVCLVSCVPVRPPEEVSLVTAITDASARAGELLAAEYEEQALDAVQGAETPEEALQALARVDRLWEPVWGAWIDLREQHDNCIISHDTCDLNALAFAWCALELQAARRNVRVPHILNCVP